MKLKIRMLEKVIEIPECTPEAAGRSALRHTLDDIGLEVKGVEVTPERGIVFTIETLANRGDHLSVWGVARELSARTLAQPRIPQLGGQFPDRRASLPVRRISDKCTRYALLEMTVPSAMPLRNDVAAFVEEPGKRHAMVDILNYVQLELGQPMHAFDYDKVEGEVVVDVASKPETIEALDGKTYQVPEGALLIKDKKKIIAVAGVIGCSNSMVTAETKKVLIEAATFDPVSVRVTARAMGLSTDASYAFERGVDPEGIHVALKRVVFLAGGSAGAVSSSDSAHVLGLTYTEAGAPEKRKVAVTLGQLRSQLNLPRLDETELLVRLKNLGYAVEVLPSGKDKDLTLTVPSWRLWDVRHADDIIEDVARSVSLNRVKSELPPLDYEAAPLEPTEKLSVMVRPALIGSGHVEVITKGFYSASDVAILEELSPGIDARHVKIANALEANYSHLKVTNVVHLTKVLSANRKRGVVAPKVYELCRIFTRPEVPPNEEPRARDAMDYDYERDVLTFAAAGRWSPVKWRKPEALEEFARLFKGVVSSVVRSIGGEFSVGKSSAPFLHPGMQGSVKIGRSVVGFFGVVHPAIREAYELKDDAFYCELDARLLVKLAKEAGAPTVSDFPSIARDLTLKVEPRDQAGRIVRLIEEVNVEALSECILVDDFSRADEGYRRVTVRLTFQHPERTLRHDEVDSCMATIVEQLNSKHRIELAM